MPGMYRTLNCCKDLGIHINYSSSLSDIDSTALKDSDLLVEFPY